MSSRLVAVRKFACAFAAALVVLAPVLARAQTADQQKCILAVNKSGSKVASTQGKNNSGCIGAAASGKLVGQDADQCITADNKGKVQVAKDKTVKSQDTKCPYFLPPYGFSGATVTNAAAVAEEIALAEAIFGSPIDPALSAASASCQGGVAKSYEKFAATRGKEFNGCKKVGFKGGTIHNPTQLAACFGTDSKGKVEKARTKIKDTIDKKCAGVTLADAFPGCSAEAGDSAALTECIRRKAECHMCLFVNAMDKITAACDQLDDGALNGSCRQCLNNITEAPEECDDGAETTSCDADCTFAECGDGTVNATAGEQCDDGNTIDGDGCDANCILEICGNGIVQPGAGEECDDGNNVDGDGCEHNCLLQGVACPTEGELMLLAGVGPSCTENADCIEGSTCDSGLSRCVSATALDSGYTGLGHNADVNHGVEVRGDLRCPSSGPLCGECYVTSLIPKNYNCRCTDDGLHPENAGTICDEPFAPDQDDCGGAICDCYFGPPLPLVAGGTHACVANRFAEDISGTANVDTGEGEINVHLRSVVYLGYTMDAPCPVCGGTCTAGKVGDECARDTDCDTSFGAADGVCGNYDATPNDGIRGGTCFSTEPAYQGMGRSCDVQSVNTTFPAPGGGGSSLDCLPDIGKNVSGLGLNLKFKQTTGSTQLPPAAIPCKNGYGLCPCGECQGDILTPCSSNADCTEGGTGLCKEADIGEQPNSCDNYCYTAGGVLTEGCNPECFTDGGTTRTGTACDDTLGANNNPACAVGDLCLQCKIAESCVGKCYDVGGGYGECSDDELPKQYCDGVVRANGKGIWGCITNADCTPSNISVLGGNCTLAEIRPCFLDPVTATGVPNANTPLAVATLCIPRTNSGGINAAAGLPGPARIKNQAKSKLFCQNNLSNLYEPGVGCPAP